MTDCDRGTNVGELVDDVLFCLDLIADVPVRTILLADVFIRFPTQTDAQGVQYVVQGIV
jgi:hypothetical protein